jgi:hypothetical protein
MLVATLFERGPEQGELLMFMNQNRQVGEMCQETKKKM